MKKFSKISFYSIFATAGSLLNVLIFPSISYGLSRIEQGVKSAHVEGQPTDLFGTAGAIASISSTLLYIVGSLSVLMLVYGGFRYVISGGNDKAITSAKNTVIYSIVGLVIAIMAYAAVNFIISALTPGGSGSGTNL